VGFGGSCGNMVGTFSLIGKIMCLLYVLNFNQAKWVRVASPPYLGHPSETTNNIGRQEETCWSTF